MVIFTSSFLMSSSCFLMYSSILSLCSAFKSFNSYSFSFNFSPNLSMSSSNCSATKVLLLVRKPFNCVLSPYIVFSKLITFRFDSSNLLFSSLTVSFVCCCADCCCTDCCCTDCCCTDCCCAGCCCAGVNFTIPNLDPFTFAVLTVCFPLLLVVTSSFLFVYKYPGFFASFINKSMIGFTDNIFIISITDIFIMIL